MQIVLGQGLCLGSQSPLPRGSLGCCAYVGGWEPESGLIWQLLVSFLWDSGWVSSVGGGTHVPSPPHTLLLSLLPFLVLLLLLETGGAHQFLLPFALLLQMWKLSEA